MDVIIAIIYAIVVLIWLWALYDVLIVSNISSSEKIFWIIIMILFNLIGILFYVLLGRKGSDYKIVER